MVVLDHAVDAGSGQAALTSEDDGCYAQFEVTDDLVW
jgi:uncharacterized protein YaiL (DUF2058 family)